jgi:hypothetical protein
LFHSLLPQYLLLQSISKTNSAQKEVDRFVAMMMPTTCQVMRLWGKLKNDASMPGFSTVRKINWAFSYVRGVTRHVVGLNLSIKSSLVSFLTSSASTTLKQIKD